MKTLLPYLQLMRLPNVFTAMADIFMGFLFVHASLAPLAEFLLLLVASSCFYTAGMVLNDLFDYAVDARLRPERPLPSARVTRRTAMGIALALLAIGLMAASLAGSTSGIVALVLIAAIFLYDGALKNTPLAPAVMGACRTLNVLLGMSSASGGITVPVLPLPASWIVPVGMGLYVSGVTWFARHEAERSQRWQLGAAAGVINAALLALAYVAVRPEFRYAQFYWVLLAVTAWRVDYRLVTAIATPQPIYVQTAVKTCLMSLVMLDATVVCGVRGPVMAIPVLALLIPSVLLGRWVYST